MNGFQRNRLELKRKNSEIASITLLKKLKSMLLDNEKRKIVIVGKDEKLFAIGDCASLYKSRNLEKFYSNDIKIVEENEKSVYLKIM